MPKGKPGYARYLVAAALARWAPGDVSLSRGRDEPRTERFFDRPFPFLVRYEDTLVPVRLGYGGGGDAVREREAVAAAARAAKN